MNRYLLPLSAIVSLSVVAPALAEEVTTSVKVSYADLNLANPAGQAALRARITHAVKAACGTADFKDSAAMADMRRCRAAASATSAQKVALAIDGAVRLANGEGMFRVAAR